MSLLLAEVTKQLGLPGTKSYFTPVIMLPRIPQQRLSRWDDVVLNFSKIHTSFLYRISNTGHFVVAAETETRILLHYFDSGMWIRNHVCTRNSAYGTTQANIYCQVSRATASGAQSAAGLNDRVCLVCISPWFGSQHHTPLNNKQTTP